MPDLTGPACACVQQAPHQEFLNLIWNWVCRLSGGEKSTRQGRFKNKMTVLFWIQGLFFFFSWVSGQPPLPMRRDRRRHSVHTSLSVCAQGIPPPARFPPSARRASGLAGRHKCTEGASNNGEKTAALPPQLCKALVHSYPAWFRQSRASGPASCQAVPQSVPLLWQSWLEGPPDGSRFLVCVYEWVCVHTIPHSVCVEEIGSMFMQRVLRWVTDIFLYKWVVGGKTT